MSPPVVLLVAPPGAAVPDVVGPLTDAGFAVQTTAPSPDAVLLLADAVADPVAVTAELRRHHPPTVPLLWLLSRDSAHLAPAALDAGADGCLLRPAPGPLLAAQLRSAIRARTPADTDVVRDLTARLRKMFDQSEADRALVERLADLSPTAIPECSTWRFGVVSAGGLEVLMRGTDAPPGILLLDVAGLGTVGGGATAFAIGRALTGELGRRDPAKTLTAANRLLRAIALPESAVVSATVAHFAGTGGATVSTAGFPAPLLVRPDAPVEVWTGSGPFLGSTDTAFAETFAELEPGEKLILLGRGAADLRPDVREIADRHRELPAQELADAIAAGLGAEGVTLVVAERIGS